MAATPPSVTPRSRPIPAPRKSQGAGVAQKEKVVVDESERRTKPPPPPPPPRDKPGLGGQKKGSSVEVDEPEMKVERHIGTKLPELIYPKDTVERSRHKVFRYLKPPIPSPEKDDEATSCIDPQPLQEPIRRRPHQGRRFQPQMSPIPHSPVSVRRPGNQTDSQELPSQHPQSPPHSPELPTYPSPTETYPPPIAAYPSSPTVYPSQSKSHSSQLRPLHIPRETDSPPLPAYPRPPSALYPPPSAAFPRPPSALYPPPSPALPSPPSMFYPPPSAAFPRPPSALYPPPPAAYSPTPSTAYSPELPPFPDSDLERQQSFSRQGRTSPKADAPPPGARNLQPPTMFVFPEKSVKTHAPVNAMKQVPVQESSPMKSPKRASPLEEKPSTRGPSPPAGVQEEIFQPLDYYVESENVFELTEDTFDKIIPWKRMAMVMFYDPLDKKSDTAKMFFKKAAESETEPSHHYAAVDCMRDRYFCESLDVTSLPTFRIYANGAVLGTIRDTTGFNDVAMKKYIETLTSIREPGSKSASQLRSTQRDSGQSKCKLSKILGFKK